MREKVIEQFESLENNGNRYSNWDRRFKVGPFVLIKCSETTMEILPLRKGIKIGRRLIIGITSKYGYPRRKCH